MNPNCDGGKCRHSTGEVRKVPYGGDGNMLLCRYCFEYEMDWRRVRNVELTESRASKACMFDIPKWESLKVYNTG